MSEIFSRKEKTGFKPIDVETAETSDSPKLLAIQENSAAGGLREILSTRELPLARLAAKCRPAELVLLTTLLLGLAPKVDAKDITELVETVETIVGNGGQSFSETQIGVFDAVKPTQESKHWEVKEGEHSNIGEIKNFVDDVKQNLQNQGYKIGGTRIKITELVGADPQGSIKHPRQSDKLNAVLLERRADQAEKKDEADLSALGGAEGFGADVSINSEMKDAKLLIIKNINGTANAENKDVYYQKNGITSGQADKFFHWKKTHKKGEYRKLTSEQQRALEVIDLAAMREQITTVEMSIDVGVEVVGEANHDKISWSTHNKKVIVIERQDGDHRWLEIAPLNDSDAEERPLAPKILPSQRKNSPIIPVSKARNTGTDFSRTRGGSLGSSRKGNIGGVRG